ncbi:hypothetical protein HMN09_00457300 [Mycena chlorophos]|uniref:Uncharacterized protein n=1 Tax=Mycena chlorophos TaxID=658473 RepID=A0A8H6WGW6_MYCCL|nr:hypothetical protein HMN09_00457300 [Mycena chlorophos]
MSSLSPRFEYLLLRVSPQSDALKLRQSIQESLTQAFGLTASDASIDVLWTGSEAPAPATGGGNPDSHGRCVVRVAAGPDAARICAAITASTAPPRLELVRKTGFLPGLLVHAPDGLL